MIKFVACMCFLFGSAGYGVLKVKEYKKRYDELLYLKYILNILLIEIESHRGTFGENCLSIAKKVKAPYKEMFMGLYQLLEKERKESPEIYLEREINKISGQILLKKEEKEILNGIIKCADATTISMPLEIIRQSLSEWEKIIKNAETVRREHSRVALVLSFTIGIVLCITLI